MSEVHYGLSFRLVDKVKESNGARPTRAPIQKARRSQKPNKKAK